MIGMLSNLVMDTITKEGVPWLLPLPFRIGFPPFKDLRITTGHFAEKFVVFPLLIVFNIVMYFMNYDKMLSVLHHII